MNAQRNTNNTTPQASTVPHINFNEFSIGQHRIRCVFPGCNGRTGKSLGVTVDADGSGVAHCFRCGAVESYRPTTGYQVPRSSIKHHAKPARLKRTTLTIQWREVFTNAEPVTHDSTVGQYLEFRGCVLPPADGDVRQMEDFKHPYLDHRGACMIALIRHIQTNEPMSLHLTFVTPNGKAQIFDKDGEPASPKIMLAGHSIKGGAIKIWGDQDVTMGLGIAEGVETALTLAHVYQPVWATISANGMAEFPVLPGLEGLCVAVDNDPAGRSAAQRVIDRYREAQIQVLATQQSCNDLNDMAQEVK